MIVPNQMLGRAQSIASVMSWSALPLGALLGGWIIKTTGNVMLVYAGVGILMLLIATAFAWLSALRRSERYLPEVSVQSQLEASSTE